MLVFHAPEGSTCKAQAPVLGGDEEPMVVGIRECGAPAELLLADAAGNRTTLCLSHALYLAEDIRENVEEIEFDEEIEDE